MKNDFSAAARILVLAGLDDPPRVSLRELIDSGLVSGAREELGRLQANGADFQRDTRDDSIWINADSFVRAAGRVATGTEPIIVH